MVINDTHRFVFVHVPKTAGTSIAAALGSLGGNNTHLVSSSTKHETLWDLHQRLTRGHAAEGGLAELSLDGHFAFGFVRNPWDRMASIYRYLLEARPRPEIDRVHSFDDFVRRAEAGESWIVGLHSLRSQTDYVAASSLCGQADFIGHTEYSLEDLSTISTRLGVRLDVPHLNASSNATSDYRRHYTDALVDIVGRMCAHDVEAFGYEFESRVPRRRCSGALQTMACSSGAMEAAFS